MLDSLNAALRRPASMSSALSAASLAYDLDRIRTSIHDIPRATQGTHLGLQQALARAGMPIIEEERKARLLNLVTELSELWRVRVMMAIGPKRLFPWTVLKCGNCTAVVE